MRFTKMLALAAACLSMALPTMAPALPVTIAGPGLQYVPNVFLHGIITGDFGTAYTNATVTPTELTSATNVGGMVVAIPATTRDYTKQYICAAWSVDATKATATTGSITLVVNGAANAATTRYTASAAGRNTISGRYCVLRSSAAAQTVSLQGVSADTNALTVNAAYLEVWNLTLN